MKLEWTTVTDKYGREENAQVILCADCGEGVWHLFLVDGDDHAHLQCVSCDAIYCEGQTCRDPHTPQYN